MSKTDQVVMERRLRPIYDAIDSGNSKKAIQEAEKVLKKHPGAVCAKILKGLALIRSDRLTEAWAIINPLDVTGVQYDENTLQAFVHCFKEAGYPHRITSLYEKAVAVAPTENNLTQLFMAHVRNKSFKSQQQVAMRLYKEFPTTPYLFWSIMSIAMQARENPEMGQKMFYPLASRMLETHVTKSGYKAGAEIELHALIMEGQGRFEDADRLLGADSSRELLTTPPQFLNARRLCLLQKAGKNDLVVERAISGLHNNSDDWTLWTLLFDSTFAMLKESVEEKNSKCIIDSLVSILGHEKFKTSKARGPHLARFEFIGRMMTADEPIRSQLCTLQLGEPVDLLAEYIFKFYSKPCCYNDISQYLWLLNDEKKAVLAEQLKVFIDGVIHQREKAGEDSDANCWAVIVNERLRRVIGGLDRMTREERRRHVQLIVRGMTQPKRNDLAGAALGQLAAAILWNEWKENDDWQSFFEMILILEWTAVRFKSDPLSKLLLSRAYAHIGGTHRMIALSKALDIKSVQRDTLGHILFPVFELTGRFNIGVMHYTELVEVFDQADKEISEALIGGYRNGAFAQIPSLVDLSVRMKRSALSVASNEMHRYLSALFVIENIDEAVNTMHGSDDTIDWDLLGDNRDLTVIPSFEKDEVKKEIDEIRGSSQREFVDMTQLRHWMSQAIGSAGQAKGARTAELRADVTLFKVHLDHCKAQYSSDLKQSRLMQSPSPVHLSQLVHGGSLEPVLLLLQRAVDVGEAVEAGESPSITFLPNIDELNALLNTMIPKFVRSNRPFYLYDEIILCARAMQSLALCQMLIKVIERKGQEVQNENRKNKTSIGKTPFIQHCDALREAVKRHAVNLLNRMDEMAEVLKEDGFSLIPSIGEDWNEEVSIILHSQRVAVADRQYKTYLTSLDDMRCQIDHTFT